MEFLEAFNLLRYGNQKVVVHDFGTGREPGLFGLLVPLTVGHRPVVVH